MRRGPRTLVLLAGLALVGCGVDEVIPGGDGDGDGDGDDEVTLEHCSFTDVLPTAGAGGTVAAGPLMAAAAERILEVPVGTALGAYTERAGFLGSAGTVDLRREPLSGAFNASVGVESAPRVKILVLSAAGETVVLVKLDLGLAFEGMLFDIETRLGPEFAGKVLLTASHSHSAWGQQTGNSIYKVGLGELRDIVYQRYLDQIEATANDAFAAMRTAKLGTFVDTNFDPGDTVTRDRRSENDELLGGPRKDDMFTLVRVDGTDDLPIAVLPIYGIHGTINGADNSFASTDATGALERLFEERFDSEVVVMHIQGAGADVSPAGGGGIDCDLAPGNEDDPCFEWLRAEGNARKALPIVEAAWTAAGAAMETNLEIEMLSRSIELGADADTFSIRGGTLEYAPFEKDRVADRMIFDANGDIISPIDEFNAPTGAALCEEENPIFPLGLMPGTDDIAPYGGCVRLDTASEILGQLLEIEFESDATHPVCQSSRTTVSALRIGDTVFGTIPGELSLLLADKIRASSPVAADKTVLIGYAQGHTGYCLTPEDWLMAGYEPSINSWGPLEGEYIGERLIELLPLAMSTERENAAPGGVDRVLTPTVVDDIPYDDPAPMAGVIPATVPERVWVRGGTPTSAQPAATVPRVSGIATFVWIGDDPIVATPVVTLEREVSPSVFEAVTRRSGRPVRDGDVLLMYTGLPVRPEEGEVQTHYWAVEWQAVPWIGATNVSSVADELDARGAVPIGNYRFRVVGSSFDITSTPFAVTAATLNLNAVRNGNNIETNVRHDAPAGYRILNQNGASNRPIAASGSVDVRLTFNNNSTQFFNDVLLDASGMVSVDAGGQAVNVASVTVTDASGNVGTTNL